MAIFQNVTLERFHQAFHIMGRGNNFSTLALDALHDWYENIGEDVELDVVSICCEWAEYDNLDEGAKDYNVDYEELEDRTTILNIWGSDKVLIRNF